MDWDGVIERNREALKRVVAALAAMAGMAVGPHPEVRAEGEPQRALPRHLHRAVLRLLRPAEAAVRRLVVIVARGLTVEPPRQRPRKVRPDPKAAHAALRSLGLAIVLPRNAPHPEVRSGAEPRRAEARGDPELVEAEPRRTLLLPLFDPIRIPRPGRPRTVPPHSAPRILSFDGARPHRLPPPTGPNDLIDASRVALRLEALASALDDLPKHARRFARWKARRDRALSSPVHGGGGPPKAVEGAFVRRLSPLRPGRPPGQRPANGRRPAHEIHDVLGDLQYFAFKALHPNDTS
jgi:hypothetical protein